MQINATFESFEEMREFAKKMAGGELPRSKQEAPVRVEKPAKTREQKPESDEAAPVKESAPAEPEETLVEEAESPESETAAYTLVDVRTKLGALTKSGKKAQVQELIKSFGVDKLSQIPEEKYAEVMQKAGEL